MFWVVGLTSTKYYRISTQQLSSLNCDSKWGNRTIWMGQEYGYVPMQFKELLATPYEVLQSYVFWHFVFTFLSHLKKPFTHRNVQKVVLYNS